MNTEQILTFRNLPEPALVSLVNSTSKCSIIYKILDSFTSEALQKQAIDILSTGDKIRVENLIIEETSVLNILQNVYSNCLKFSLQVLCKINKTLLNSLLSRTKRVLIVLQPLVKYKLSRKEIKALKTIKTQKANVSLQISINSDIKRVKTERQYFTKVSKYVKSTGLSMDLDNEFIPNRYDFYFKRTYFLPRCEIYFSSSTIKVFMKRYLRFVKDKNLVFHFTYYYFSKEETTLLVMMEFLMRARKWENVKILSDSLFKRRDITKDILCNLCFMWRSQLQRSEVKIAEINHWWEYLAKHRSFFRK